MPHFLLSKIKKSENSKAQKRKNSGGKNSEKIQRYLKQKKVKI